VKSTNPDRKIDSQRSVNKPELPPSPAHDPIEPDPMNPKSEEPPGSESQTSRRPDLDWAGEHED
jgi:hypothetical protein